MKAGAIARDVARGGRSRWWLILAAGWLLAAAALPQTAFGVTPDSPEVRNLVTKALKYLETASDGRLGGKCLIGLAFLKDGADEEHPKVKEAVAACQNAAKPDAASIKADIYSTGIAIIFLCSLNPSKYSPEIMKLRDSLEHRQKSNGAWGYPERDTGDTSMTQYGVLAYWEMKSAGIPTSVESTERVADWLLRTQDPGGNWGYQGKEADDLRKLVKQDANKLGMSAAAMGCTFMVADLLNLSNLETDRDATLPPALRLVRDDAQNKALTQKIELRHIRAAQTRGKQWIRDNYKIDPAGFTHYYLYALERYQSFSEASEGRYAREPKWYNDGYSYLRRTQELNGSWKGEQENMEAVNTAFGALFLLRSTRKAIERSKTYGEGALLAGRGLPQKLDAVRTLKGYVVPQEPAASTAELIDLLHRPDDERFAIIAADTELLARRVQAAEAAERKEHLQRLRSLAFAGSDDARLAAVAVLGRLRDLESAPALIAALADGDLRVAQAAERSLQSLSRDSSPAQLAGAADDKTRADAQARWRLWYLAVRPDADLPR